MRITTIEDGKVFSSQGFRDASGWNVLLHLGCSFEEGEYFTIEHQQKEKVRLHKNRAGWMYEITLITNEDTFIAPKVYIKRLKAPEGVIWNVS